MIYNACQTIDRSYVYLNNYKANVLNVNYYSKVKKYIIKMKRLSDGSLSILYLPLPSKTILKFSTVKCVLGI